MFGRVGLSGLVDVEPSSFGLILHAFDKVYNVPLVGPVVEAHNCPVGHFDALLETEPAACHVPHSLLWAGNLLVPIFKFRRLQDTSLELHHFVLHFYAESLRDLGFII